MPGTGNTRRTPKGLSFSVSVSLLHYSSNSSGAMAFLLGSGVSSNPIRMIWVRLIWLFANTKYCSCSCRTICSYSFRVMWMYGYFARQIICSEGLIDSATKRILPSESYASRINPGRPCNFHGPYETGMSSAKKTVYRRPLKSPSACRHGRPQMVLTESWILQEMDGSSSSYK